MSAPFRSFPSLSRASLLDALRSLASEHGATLDETGASVGLVGIIPPAGFLLASVGLPSWHVETDGRPADALDSARFVLGAGFVPA